MLGRGVGGGGLQLGTAGPSALSPEGLSPALFKGPGRPRAAPCTSASAGAHPRGSAGLPLLSGTISRSPEAQEAGGVRGHPGDLADARARL